MIGSFLEFVNSDDAPAPELVADAVVELVEMDGDRPLRTVVGVDYGVRSLNDAVAPIQEGLLDALGAGAAA